MVGQAGGQWHNLEVYSTRGVSVALLCLQLLILFFSLPLSIGRLLSLSLCQSVLKISNLSSTRTISAATSCLLLER